MKNPIAPSCGVSEAETVLFIGIYTPSILRTEGLDASHLKAESITFLDQRFVAGLAS